MKIALQMLKDKKACASQITLFKKTFGQSVEVTLDLCLEHASSFNWNWATRNLLSPEARKDYLAAVAAAEEDYLAAVAAAWFAGWEKTRRKEVIT